MRLINPVFLRVTGKRVVDPMDRTEPIGIALNGVHFLDAPDRIGYHFTRCMWAEVYRELGEPDLGFVICSSDEPAVKAHNAQLGFSRTQVLMHGAPLCNHVFFVETEQALPPHQLEQDV